MQLQVLNVAFMGVGTALAGPILTRPLFLHEYTANNKWSYLHNFHIL